MSLCPGKPPGSRRASLAGGPGSPGRNRSHCPIPHHGSCPAPPPGCPAPPGHAARPPGAPRHSRGRGHGAPAPGPGPGPERCPVGSSGAGKSSPPVHSRRPGARTGAVVPRGLVGTRGRGCCGVDPLQAVGGDRCGGPPSQAFAGGPFGWTVVECCPALVVVGLPWRIPGTWTVQRGPHLSHAGEFCQERGLGGCPV